MIFHRAVYSSRKRGLPWSVPAAQGANHDNPDPTFPRLGLRRGDELLQPRPLLAAFADDALVNDHRDEFIGKEQIRAWAAREIIGDQVTMKVIDVRLLGSHVALKAEVDGAFDKKGLPSPLVLAFYFSVSDGRISALVIVNNKTAS